MGAATKWEEVMRPRQWTKLKVATTVTGGFIMVGNTTGSGRTGQSVAVGGNNVLKQGAVSQGKGKFNFESQSFSFKFRLHQNF